MNENNFETDDFEHVLKEHADQFFLIPSERIWKSIYNDLHPGSKWPSLAVGLFMLLTLFWVGNTNRNENGPIEVPQNNLSSENVSGANTPLAQLVPDEKKPAASLNSSVSAKKEALVVQLPNTFRNLQSSLPGTLAPVRVMNTDGRTVPEIERSGVIVNNEKSVKTEKIVSADKIASENTLKSNNVTQSDRNIATISSGSGGSKLETSRSQFNIKRAKKLHWEYFITPMISSVQFGGLNLNNSGSGVVYSPVSKHDMNIAKRLGFTTGANAYYPITNRLSLTSGAHLVYTGYNIFTNTMHPDYTSLTFRDSKGKLFSKNYVSYYANDKKDANISITNYNFQLSIPVGIKWDLVSNENFKISVVSTIEPFVVLGSKAYLLSGDASSYVTDPDIIRKLNLSGNIGSVVTFSSNTVNWNIGPNFRYQILSTYNNIYPVKEHFVNYGLHVGISKKE